MNTKRSYPKHAGIDFTPDECRVLFGLTKLAEPLNLDDMKQLEELKEALSVGSPFKGYMIPPAATLEAVLESIKYKIAMFEAEKHLEELLAVHPAETESESYDQLVSTKKRSYRRTKATQGAIKSKIITALESAGTPLSRTEIAQRAGIRLSSVTGQIPLLKDENLVRVVGTKIDEESDRKVELIALN